MEKAPLSKTSFRIKQIQGLLTQILKSKRGAFGVAILVVASIVALAAPVLAPHDPVKDTNLAGSYCAPIWYPRIFGGPYSENMYLIDDPLFENGKDLGKWISPSDGSIQVSLTSMTGYDKTLTGQDYNKPGALMINLTNPSGEI